VGALSHLLSKPAPERDHYNIFGIRYSQYFRTDLSFSRKEVLGAKTALAYRLYAGAGLAYGNSTEIPIDRLFYAGGSNSMRGWAARTLGPGSVTITEDQRIYPSQVGNMKIEANLEFRFPIWSMFNGALFFDAGNVFMIGQKGREYAEGSVFHFNDFYKNIGFNTGLGIRLDISFAVLRFDWGIRLYDPNQPMGERWIHNFRWKNTALNFGVGYPF
jgi:outer membrane protein assembly factor BamA